LPPRSGFVILRASSSKGTGDHDELVERKQRENDAGVLATAQPDKRSDASL
jgi:hypothetical protein